MLPPKLRIANLQLTQFFIANPQRNLHKERDFSPLQEKASFPKNYGFQSIRKPIKIYFVEKSPPSFSIIYVL